MLKSYKECAEFIRELQEMCATEQYHFPCTAEYLVNMDDDSFMRNIHPQVVNEGGEQFCSLMQHFRAVRSEILSCVN